MYKLTKDSFTGKTTVVVRLSDNACIPFDPANTDYQTFKKDLANGAELSDADGNVIDGIAYLETLESQGNE
jgi:hypothetical protein